MLTILLHSSKTMVPTSTRRHLSQPVELDKTRQLQAYVAALSHAHIQKSMHISERLAKDVLQTYGSWSDSTDLTAAAEIFRGDIYSGLRALDFTTSQKDFAQKHLVILSGLYGILRPYDGISPYRLEAAYRFPDTPFENLYTFWADSLAKHISNKGPVVNVTSAEYEKLILPYVDSARIVTPRFLSILKPGQPPKFVVVHAKIARGAYARWLIQREQDDISNLQDFSDLGYRYDTETSTPQQPVYICETFEGIGLSQRLI